MKARDWRTILGVGLIALGALALLQSLGILSPSGSLVAVLFGVLFALGGLAFLSVVWGDRTEHWWAVIPGMVLLSLGGLMLLTQFFPAFADKGGGFFLGGIALAFWLVYVLRRDFWWALIPAGTLTTLAVVAALDEFAALEGGGVFFLGLALTFALVALLPKERMTWPWIPAGVLLVLGVGVLFSAGALVNYVWPAALILGGVYLIFRSIRGS